MFTTDAQQHNSGYGALSAKDQIAEIFVFGKQQSHLARRECDDIGIAQTGSGFCDIEHVVTVGPQKRNQGCCDAFVSEPAHVLAVNDVFVGEIIGGKCLRGTDVVKR